LNQPTSVFSFMKAQTVALVKEERVRVKVKILVQVDFTARMPQGRRLHSYTSVLLVVLSHLLRLEKVLKNYISFSPLRSFFSVNS